MIEQITIDDQIYRVRVKPDTIRRIAALIEGPNAGDLLSGRHERDLLGTKYSYRLEIEPDWVNYADYDAFYYAITAPVDSHIVSLPFGQITLTFAAMIEAVEDTLIGTANGVNRWHGLTVHFKPTEAQREVADDVSKSDAML